MTLNLFSPLRPYQFLWQVVWHQSHYWLSWWRRVMCQASLHLQVAVLRQKHNSKPQTTAVRCHWNVNMSSSRLTEHPTRTSSTVPQHCATSAPQWGVKGKNGGWNKKNIASRAVDWEAGQGRRAYADIRDENLTCWHFSDILFAGGWIGKHQRHVSRLCYPFPSDYRSARFACRFFFFAHANLFLPFPAMRSLASG